MKALDSGFRRNDRNFVFLRIHPLASGQAGVTEAQ
jgi:hypothetical protein